MTKRCSTCKQSKPPRAFYKNRKAKDGLQNNCKECLLEMQRLKRERIRNGDHIVQPRQKDRESLRRCTLCKKWKYRNKAFRPFKMNRGGRVYQCRICENTRIKKRRRENWAHRMREYAIGRHKRYEDPCNLTAEHIEVLWDRQKGLCALFHIPMIQDMDSDDRLRLVTLDRIDSSKGYTKKNTALVCKAANQCRGNTSMRVFRTFVQEVRGN